MHTNKNKDKNNIIRKIKLKTGTINANGMSEKSLKFFTVIDQINNANLDICAIQETLILLPNGHKSATVKNYDIYMSGYKRKPKKGSGESSHNCGVAVAVRKNPNITVTDVEAISPRLIAVHLDIFGFQLKVVSAYAPPNTDTTSEAMKDKFWKSVKDATKTTKNQSYLILGDFNSTSSLLVGEPSYFAGQEVQNIQNNANGQRLIEFCIATRSSILNTFFSHKNIHKISWYSHDGKTEKVLDLAVCNKNLRKFCVDTRVRRSFDFQSDHRLLVSRFQIPFSKKHRKNPPTRNKTVKFDYKNIQPENKEKFVQNLENELQNNTSATAQNLIQILESSQINSINKISKKLNGLTPGTTINN